MKQSIKVITIILAGMILLACGFFLGRVNMKTEETVTFYATIKTVQESGLDVKGLAVNDINYRGDFSLDIHDGTEITWRSENIPLSDLKPGDRISITYSGAILETYPARITDVQKISLLNDK